MSQARQVELLIAGVTDELGRPVASGKVYFFAPNSTSPATIYDVYDKSSEAANPVVLDADGKAPSPGIWVDGPCKIVIKDADDDTLYTWDYLYYGIQENPIYWGGVSTGNVNAYGLGNVSIPALADGVMVVFYTHLANTGAATLNVANTGTKDLQKAIGVDLTSGQIAVDSLVLAAYVATEDVWLLIN